MNPHLRIARPVTELAATVAQYRAGLGLEVIGGFAGHDGFDGAMLALPGAEWHLEFTVCTSKPVTPTPTAEDLLVIYVENPAEWEARCAAMLAAGFTEVASHNPYWSRLGRTFADRDGYRVVVQRAAWMPNGTRGQAPLGA